MNYNKYLFGIELNFIIYVKYENGIFIVYWLFLCCVFKIYVFFLYENSHKTNKKNRKKLNANILSYWNWIQLNGMSFGMQPYA